MQKRDFFSKTKLVRAMVSIDDLQKIVHGLFKELIIGMLKSKMANVRMLSVSTDTGPQSFCHSFIALPKIRCKKSTQKCAVQVCQVATDVNGKWIPAEPKDWRGLSGLNSSI